MNQAIAACMAAGMLTAPAWTQEFQADDLNRLEATLARVKPGVRAAFETGNWRYGWRSQEPAQCRRTTYVIGADVVLVGQIRGKMIRAAYTNGKRMTLDWLPRAALVAIPTPTATLAAWRGHWRRDDEASVDVGLGAKRGTVKFDGEALYGSHDPDRVKRGAVNLGAFGGESAPVNGRVDLAADDDVCHVKMRLIGPYLAVVDNGQCGGMNVSFSGVYRKI